MVEGKRDQEKERRKGGGRQEKEEVVKGGTRGGGRKEVQTRGSIERKVDVEKGNMREEEKRWK